MISVVIPVWNNALQLARALEALTKQTWKEFDVTVIDDGSRDRLAQEVAGRTWPFPVAYHRLEQNGGAPRARNEGARRSTGGELFFLDADIVLREDALEQFHQALIEHPEAAFAYADLRFGWKRLRGRLFDAHALRNVNYIPTSSLVRRSAFPGFDESLKKFQDWDLWLTIVSRGGTGCWIPEELIRAETGGTMSSWLPACVHRLPWPLFGWMPPAMRKYLAAERIIRDKHGLAPRLHEDEEEMKRAGVYTFVVVACVMSVSFAAYTASSVMTGVALVVGALLAYVAYAYPLVACGVWLAELVVGSFGGLLRAFGDPMLHGGASLRYLVFGAMAAASVVRLVLHKNERGQVWERMITFFRTYSSLGLLALAVGGGVLLGLVQNDRANVFQDANAWIMWALLPVFVGRLSFSTQRTWKVLTGICVGAFAYLTLITWKTWFFYAHPFSQEVVSYVYLWIRRTRLGEITRVIEGMQLHRVFFQSQIYALLALPFVWRARRRLGSIAAYSVILISLSRSFWVGAAVMILMALVLRARAGGIGGACRFFVREATSFFGAFVLVWGLAVVPIPPTNASLIQVLTSRAAGQEGAVSSRRAQLGPLLEKIKEAPLFGSGFGTTVTYTSFDPRVLATGTNQRTTFAFEWGWLDLLVKIGVVGVLAYITLLGQALRVLWKRVERDEWIAWATALMGLVTVHMFTPYLNHPLGFGFLFLLLLRGM